MKLLFLLGFALVSACAPARVTHPGKTPVEMQADIDLCTKEANRTYWMDPVAAMYNAYDCLEAKGYQRDSAHFSSQVERALGEAPAKPTEPAQPCAVPCKKNP